MASLTNDLAATQRAREHFENLIQNPDLLGPDFEPVRRLGDRSIEGWQAVGRGVDSSVLGDRDAFVRTATALGLAERLDWTFRCRIFDVAAVHNVKEQIHVKVAIAAYGTVPPPRLAVAFGRARALNVTVEIHELAYDDPTTLATGLGEFAKWGWTLAVGDISGRTDASTILQKVRPAIATVDLSRPGSATSDQVKRYVDTANRLGIEVLACGLDTPLQAIEAENLGAALGRGKAIGPAVPIPA